MAKQTQFIPNPKLIDFKNFLYLVWLHLGLPEPTSVQYDIADYLQYKGYNRKIIEAYRGVGKSFITAAYVCWKLYMNKNEKILVVSQSKDKAIQFTTQTRRLIEEMSILKHLIPDKSQRDSVLAFDVFGCSNHQSASVSARGITGQITGSRATLIIADDVETQGNSGTQAQREKLRELVKEFESILSPGGEIVFLGTPQTIESLYNKLKRSGYNIRIWTGRYPKTIKDMESYGEELAPMIRDSLLEDNTLFWKLTDPKRMSDEEMEGKRLSVGNSTYQLQFMLDTTLSDIEKYPLKQEDFIVMDVDKDKAPIKVVWSNDRGCRLEELENFGFTGDRWHKPIFISEEWTDYNGSVMTIDPSGRGKDETSYCVIKQLNGMMYITAIGGIKGGYEKESLFQIADIARQNTVNVILVESNFGDGIFLELLKPILRQIYPCTLEEVRHNTQKERRIIDTLEPALNQHRLVIDKRIIKQRNFNEDTGEEVGLDYNLIYQLTHITKERGSLVHDDRLEALSMAVNYWVEHLGQSQEDGIERYKEEMFLKELEKFTNAYDLQWKSNKNNNLWVNV